MFVVGITGRVTMVRKEKYFGDRVFEVGVEVVEV